MNHTPYKKLSGKHRGFTGFSQLWLGPDHVLVVHSTRVREAYQRFFFSDIQAIVISEGPERRLVQALAAVVAVGLGIWGFQAGSAAGRWLLWIAGALAGVLLIRDIAKGPYCRCVIQTAVSRERVYPLSRIKTARRFLETVSPLIETAQQDGATPEASGPDVMESPAATASGLSVAGESEPAPPALRRELGYAPEAFFGLLLLTAVLMFIGLRSSFEVLLGVFGTVYVSEAILGVIAAVNTRSRNTAAFVLASVALCCIGADLFVVTGASIWKQGMEAFTGGAAALKMRGPMLVSSNTTLFAEGWRILLGVAGLAACYRVRSKESA